MHSMSSQVSSWTLMGDFVVQECCVHVTDLESHGPTSILCDDPLPLLTIMESKSSFRILLFTLLCKCALQISSSISEHNMLYPLVSHARGIFFSNY